jgi:predicted transcriptional regulator
LSEDNNTLAHIGVLHKSGRYPWGSGANPYERSQGFLQYVSDLRKKGLSDTDIAKAMGIKTPELRANKTMARNEVKKAEIARALQLSSKGMSNVAIGKLMGRPESTVRTLLAEDAGKRADQQTTIANVLKDHVANKTFVDVGVGTANHLGVSTTQLTTAIAMLKEQGYKVFWLKQPQLGTNHETTLKVLAPKDATYNDLLKNRDKVATVTDYSENNGTSFSKLEPPTVVNPKRVDVRYGSEGGAKMDGVIQLRRGVDDISMGAARYAQVRIQVGKDRYLKGMAVYADDLPDGVDIRFNTNKENTGNKLDAMKKTKNDDPNNPFGSTIRQKHYVDASGKEQLSALNIVNDEGQWNDWGNTLSSQFLSKQSPKLAESQLNMRYDSMQSELGDISKLTNPVVKRQLLQAFSDSADSSAVHLKAAGLPRTKSHVILPVNSLKDNEIYAPGYNNGEKVVLVRHPHGGIFEIPELTVNNKNREANSVIKNAQDAVGINSNVASRLSGADFDGDTVLVIPNDSGKVKTSPSLKELENFDPQTAYPKYDGMKVISPQDKQHKMGDISNLITDMTIKGANQAELARAVKHSMVVIDAEKHELNYKQSYIDNGIAELKKKYQGSPRAGASTLISKSGSKIDVLEKKQRPADQGGPIDKDTGEKKFVPTDVNFEKQVVNKRTGEVTTKTVYRTQKSTRGAEAKDAFDLVSENATPIETVYANYSNRMKALANEARKEMVNTPSMKSSPSAKTVYANEVATLKAKLNEAQKNAPLERQAQIVGATIVKAKKEANPNMDADDLKKAKSQALDEARSRVGAKKKQVEITDREWDAIQAGAVSTNVLEQLIKNADLDRVKELATPREVRVMDSAKLSRAQVMISSGYTQAEVAAALGVSVSTLSDALHPKSK